LVAENDDRERESGKFGKNVKSENSLQIIGVDKTKLAVISDFFDSSPTRPIFKTIIGK